MAKYATALIPLYPRTPVAYFTSPNQMWWKIQGNVISVCKHHIKRTYGGANVKLITLASALNRGEWSPRTHQIGIREGPLSVSTWREMKRNGTKRLSVSCKMLCITSQECFMLTKTVFEIKWSNKCISISHNHKESPWYNLCPFNLCFLLTHYFVQTLISATIPGEQIKFIIVFCIPSLGF